MSRVGKYPVEIKEGVQVTLANNVLMAKGKLGELSITIDPTTVKVKIEDKKVIVEPISIKDKFLHAMWGTVRANIKNIIMGVSEGFTKTLELKGVGYKAALQGKVLKLSLSFSHDVDYPIPEGIKIEVATPTEIKISGADKRKVGQVAAEIRSYRKPEPYKGKGVHYKGEHIVRKEGKKK
jgi:large subunit ribosomal protein L6